MNIQKDVSLREHSTLQVGGIAEYFVSVATQDELREAVLWAAREGVPYFVIGEGSNILFADEGVKGLVIQNTIRGIKAQRQERGILLTAGAGELLDGVVAYACKEGWWGLENLSAIPGTVGATPIQNVGAYGTEVAELIDSVSVYDSEEDAFAILTNADCAFSYRHSVFKEVHGARYLICSVTFLLPKDRGPKTEYRDLAERFTAMPQEALTPETVRQAVIEIRSGKFPDWRVVGTAGSFFKNPIVSLQEWEAIARTYPEMPAHSAQDGGMKLQLGWILDHVCSMRGVREGNVGTFERQALVLVNYGGATAHEIKNFAERIATCVKNELSIDIEWEVTQKN